MKDFLNFILAKILDDASDIEIVEIKNEYEVTVLNIRSPKEKIGMIVGRGGKIIQAIRNLVKVLAVKTQMRVLVNVLEK